MASWVDDVVPAPGRLLAELYRKLGPGANGLMKGTATVGDRPVDLKAVAMPVLSVSAEKDTIAPPAGVDAVRRSCRRPRFCGCRVATSASSPAAPPPRCGSAPSSSWVLREARACSVVHPVAGASHLRLRARRRQAAVPRSRHRLQRRHVGAVHAVLPESANLISFDAPGAGRSSTPVFPVSGRLRWRRSRPPCSTIAASSARTSSASRTAAPSSQQLAYDYPERVCRLVLAATNCGLGSFLGSPEAMAVMATPLRFYSASLFRARRRRRLRRRHGARPRAAAGRERRAPPFAAELSTATRCSCSAASAGRAGASCPRFA